MQIFVNGVLVGSLERNGHQFVTFDGTADDATLKAVNGWCTLDILVYNIGRINTNVYWDLKGLISKLVLLNSMCPLPSSWLSLACQTRRPCIDEGHHDMEL
jgi:hypothetical protein